MAKHSLRATAHAPYPRATAALIAALYERLFSWIRRLRDEDGTYTTGCGLGRFETNGKRAGNRTVMMKNNENKTYRTT